MKLDNSVPFGRPQSGTVIIQLMTELDVSDTAIPNPFRKQSNAPSFTSKNEMSQFTYLENIQSTVV